MLINKNRLLRIIKRSILITVCLLLLLLQIYDLILTTSFDRIASSSNDLYKNEDLGENLKIHMIDVGQGDGFVLTINDKVIVIDTGPMLHKFKMSKYLESIGIKRINVLIITHPHQDHFGGLDSLLCKFKVDKIYTTEITSKVNMSLCERFHLYEYNYIISKYNVFNKFEKISSITDEHGNLKTITIDDVKIKFLGPTKVYDNFNNNSIVCKIEYKDISMLFTGDIQSEAEQDLVEQYGDELNVDILKISHHGSHTSSIEDFIATTNPKIALISCETNNSLFHPHKSIAERLEENNIKLYRTDENGTVVLTTDGHTIETDQKVGDYKCGTEISEEISSQK